MRHEGMVIGLLVFLYFIPKMIIKVDFEAQHFPPHSPIPQNEVARFILLIPRFRQMRGPRFSPLIPDFAR